MKRSIPTLILRSWKITKETKNFLYFPSFSITFILIYLIAIARGSVCAVLKKLSEIRSAVPKIPSNIHPSIHSHL
uniref:Uncharacterized protein n=1 Tax=Papilio xuthus TaxID=66420 RepID=I4DLS3_PAPXU|nr:unknown unsecreted protein [Papilio xuthus]